MASVAFFNFVADTNFIALVICCVEMVELILDRTAFKFAISLVDYALKLAATEAPAASIAEVISSLNFPSLN